MKLISASSRIYLEKISEFISFLAVNELSLEEIFSHIVQVVLSPLNAEAMTLDFLNDKNKVENMGRWGMPLEMVKDYVDVYNLTDRYPSTDTLRYRNITYVNTLPEWGEDYPLLKSFHILLVQKVSSHFQLKRHVLPLLRWEFLAKM